MSNGIAESSHAPRIEELRDALCRSSWPTVRSLQVSVDQGVVTVRGYVRSYYERQMAHQELMAFPGVDQVDDQMEVLYV